MYCRCFLIALVVAVLASPLRAEDVDAWEFDVFLDDKEIGFHRFEVRRDGAVEVMRTEASFDVKFLFINAFRYRHRNTERWADGCLTSIDATTERNGDRLKVIGAQRNDVFAVQSTKGETELSTCVLSFAYWNPEILETRRLLNSQTGDYEEVEVTFEGDDRVRVGERLVPAQRFQLATAAGNIKLWYADDGRWLSLEAPAKGGRTLRYRPLSVPAGDRDDRLVASSGDRRWTDEGNARKHSRLGAP